MGSCPRQKMDEKNLQTPLVIHVASREEQKDQNLYNVEFENLESPKEYVIDQIFCGENLTVYALFEISDLSDNKSEKNLIEVPDSSTNEEFRFYHRSSCKKSIEENELNGFKSNHKNFSKDEAGRVSTNDTGQESESFYCVKNYGGQCEVTRGVDDRSNLKVLYSKNQNVGKFKLVSKGVNTDIAQCPKLVDDVRKAISIGRAFSEGDGKTIEIQTFPPVKSSYELIEIETAPSSSSCNSDVDDYRRHNPKTSPNVLVVPLLMMDEGILNTLKSDNKNQQLMKEKKCPSSEKVSLGVNTDFSCIEFLDRWKESDNDQESNFERTRTRNPNPAKGSRTKCKESDPDEKNEDNHETEGESDLTTKRNILKEIKYLQDKLNILIKSLECGESKDSKPKILIGEKTSSVTQFAQQSRQPSVQQVDSTTEPKRAKRNQRRYDDRPIFSPVSYDISSTKPVTSEARQKPSSGKRENPTESLPIQAKSTVSILTKSASSIFRVSLAWNTSNGKEDLIEELDMAQFFCSNFGKNNKSLPVSKSDCSLRLTRLCSLDSKLDLGVGLKKALSYELGEEKTDAMGAKKMKFPSLKSDGNFKSKNNALPKNITPLICEMGDEIGKKLKQDVLIVERTITKDEGLLKVLEKQALLTELKKTSQNDEEGDARISYEAPPFSVPPLAFAAKNEKIVVNYCNTNGDRTMKPEKSFKKVPGQPGIKSALSIDIEPKVSGQIEKPITHSKNDKKLNAEANAKKDLKINNLFKSKIPDKINKSPKKETVQSESFSQKHRPLALSRPRSSGQSKLHVDKLIKKAPASANEIASNRAQAKSEREEKLSGKSDQHHSPKTTPLKRERREVIQAPTESKERETVPKQNETFDSAQNQTVHSNCSHPAQECYSQKRDFEDRTVPEDKPRIINLLTEPSPVGGTGANSPSVVVELFSKKQSSTSDSHTDFDQDFTTGADTDTSHVCLNEKNLTADAENMDGTLETGVKSVWALTKVLLYGDGTKKFEVLEVSLTPPECSLNNEKQNDQKNG